MTEVKYFYLSAYIFSCLEVAHFLTYSFQAQRDRRFFLFNDLLLEKIQYFQWHDQPKQQLNYSVFLILS